MKAGALLLLLAGMAAAQELPDAPQPVVPPAPPAPHWRTIEAPAPRPIGTFSGRHIGDPALRSPRQTLTSPSFYLPQAAGWIATAVDFKINRSQSGKVDAFVPAAALTGLSYTLDRWVWRPLGWLSAGIVTAIHVHGAVTGRYR
jgi:hypothetical protein